MTRRVPMQDRHPILVALLLVTFVTGGVIGPVAHHVQHGGAQRSPGSETPCHPADVHEATGAVWTDAAKDLRVPECDLCARRLLLVSSAPGPSVAPRVRGSAVVQPRSHVAAARVANDRFIRGPPLLSGVRSA